MAAPWRIQEKARHQLLQLYTRNIVNGELKTFRIHEGEVGEAAAIASSPDGKMLASGGLEGQRSIWDTATGEEIVPLTT